MLSLIAGRACAEAPRTLPFQGVLTGPSGVPKPDGVYALVLRLYDAPSGGSLLWTEPNQAVSVAGGHGLFHTTLGAPTSFGALPFDEPYYLEVQAPGDVPMMPRLPLQAVPYALHAAGASITLPYSGSGTSGSALVRVTNQGDGSGVYGATGGTGASVAGVVGEAAAGSGVAAGVLGVAHSDGGFGVVAKAPAVAGQFTATNPVSTGIAVYGESTGAYIESHAKAGHGVDAYASGSGGIGVHGKGATGRGVWGESVSGSGVVGTSSAWIGVYGSSASSYGAWGESTSSVGVVGDSVTSVGVYGESRSDGHGIGDDGVRGLAHVAGKSGVAGVNDSVGGYGVYGTAPSSSGIGVYGTAQGFNGIGVFGTASGSDGARGVYGSTTSGTGVYGEAVNDAGTAVFGASHTGASGSLAARYNGELSYASGPLVYRRSGFSVGALGVGGPGDNVGVMGIATGHTMIEGPMALAGAFLGDVLITGETVHPATLSPSGAASAPAAPDRVVLQRAVEAPQPLNLYRGRVTTDAEGRAEVRLPDYFEALNTEIGYSLTCIGQFARAIVADEVDDGRFTIQTDKPNVTVSWLVTGVRRLAGAP